MLGRHGGLRRRVPSFSTLRTALRLSLLVRLATDPLKFVLLSSWARHLHAVCAEGQLAGSVGGAPLCVSLRLKARLAVALEFASSLGHGREVSVGLAYRL